LEDSNEALVGFQGNKADVITGLQILKVELKIIEKKTIRVRVARKKNSSLKLEPKESASANPQMPEEEEEAEDP
jgi:hypothetical protein